VGTVRALRDDGEAEVDVSGMRVRTRIRDLEPVSRSERPAETIQVSAAARSTLTVPSELHLRGLRVDEALEQLDRYLHDVAMAGVPRVRIVHGKGTGAVRRAVWDALPKHSLVRNFELAAPAEGGAGVTVVDVATV
jgi:DNA mismatch repair protein MutS2